MKVYAIGDLHLSHSGEKPMDVFGRHWEGHRERIGENWRAVVSSEDLVLVPGDISWGMRMIDAIPDLEWLGGLPGRKVIIRGNHDYWWPSISRLRRDLPSGILPLQCSAVDVGPCVVAGTRGWKTPMAEDFIEDDGPIYRRELGRLDLSLAEAAGIREGISGRPLLVMMHYPPVWGGEPSEFSARIAASGARICVYGHIHALPGEWPDHLDTELDGVEYRLVSADHLDFRPLLLTEL